MSAIEHDDNDDDEQRVATNFINEWAESGSYDLQVNEGFLKQLRSIGDLSDVDQVLKTCVVTKTDMIGMSGLWTVRGVTADEVRIELDLKIDSEGPKVEPLSVRKVRKNRRR
jgi:hypothetical protein